MGIYITLRDYMEIISLSDKHMETWLFGETMGIEQMGLSEKSQGTPYP